MTFMQCCDAILADPKANPYAKSYAAAGLRLDSPREIQTQALYILCNIGHWRGDRAKEVRAALKKIGGES